MLRGFTIIELLVVVALVAILMGIIFPVMAYAKRQAMVTVDVSNLKSIGVAIALYQEDWNDRAPTVAKLVHAGYITEGVAVSPLDKTPQGQANEFELIAGKQPDPARLSYLSLADSTETEIDRVLASRGGGSVVSLAEARYLIPSEGVGGYFTGDYLRLCMDGSVQKRKIIWDGPSHDNLRSNHLWLFTDEKELFPVSAYP